MNSFGDYVSAFDEWKRRLPRKEKEADIKKYNNDWSTIYTIWNQRFKDEVWKPHKEALRKKKYCYSKMCLDPKTPKSGSKSEKRKVAVLSDDSDLEEQITNDLIEPKTQEKKAKGGGTFR